jgi:IS605 OrfB family transposase
MSDSAPAVPRLVHRTATVRLRATRRQTRRCYGLLRSAGDVWAWLLDTNRLRRHQGDRPVTGYQALCRELTSTGPFGELSMTGARSVLRRYSDAWFQTAKRRGQQGKAGFPRRKHSLVPVRFYHGTFLLDGNRVRLPVARRVPTPGQRGSRRWRRHRARLRKVEARHRRRVHQAQHQAAKQVIAFAVQQRIGTLLIGDPKGITGREVGRVHNLRLRRWRRTHLVQALRDKAEQAGIVVRLVDERGTSSTCPACHQRVPKPKSREFRCPHCRFQGHRDLVGAHNIAAKTGGGSTSTGVPVLVEHRRAGRVPARRDRRRHLHDQRRRRSCLASGHPGEHADSPGCRSSDTGRYPASREDQAALPNEANVA